MIKPPFCPIPTCVNHHTPPPTQWWTRSGFHHTEAFSEIPRFRCKACNHTFSSQTFSTHYYAKRVINLRTLEQLNASSMSLRALSRHYAASCATIQNRVDRLARQAIALHAALRPLASRYEWTCFDGFVSFDGSQYFPSDIGISLTSDSQFILTLTHATTRRSGRKTESQAKKVKILYQGLSFEKKAIERSFTEHLNRLARERPPGPARSLVLVTDEKLEYCRAFYRHPLFSGQDEDHRISQVRVNSKLPRAFSNPLFSSNYIDREIRKDQANHRRESTCFCREPANGMSRLMVYIAHHNYEKLFRINLPKGSNRTHAEEAGISRDAIARERSRYFTDRVFLSRISLDETDQQRWKKELYRVKLGKVAGVRLPKYATA